MNNSLSSWMGWRYLRAGHSGFSKLVNVISYLGLTLGIALVIVVSSVHNGLSVELQNRLLKIVPHAFVPDPQPTEEFRKNLEKVDGVLSVQPEFQTMASVQGPRQQVVVQLRGVSFDSIDNADILSVEGELKDLGANGIAVSPGLASLLGVELGDQLRVMFVQPHDGGLTSRSATFQLAALFSTATPYDAGVVFTSVGAIEPMNLGGVGRFGWNINVADPMQVEESLSSVPTAVTWVDLHGEIFKAFQLERVVMYLVMALVLILASFNIIAGQSMLINVKRSDIAILITMGFEAKKLTRVFLLQGGIIVIFGIASGVMVGILIALNVGTLFESVDRLFGIAILEGSLFEQLPAKISTVDTLVGAVIAFLLGAIALIRPLHKVLEENPSQVLNRVA